MGNEYTPETKGAVMGALLAGQSVSSVAREYDIPKGTVSGWKHKAYQEASGVVSAATQKREEVGNLVLEYLVASLTALKAQANAFADPEWIKRQNASEIAVLHGVVADKAVRLLEALSGDEEEV